MNKDKQLSQADLLKLESLVGEGIRYDMLSKFFGMDQSTLKQIVKDLRKKKQLEEMKKKKFSPTKTQDDFDQDELIEEETTGEVRRSKYSQALDQSKRTVKAITESSDVPQDDIQRMRLLRTMGYSPYVIATTFGVPFNRINGFIRDIKPEKSIRAVKVLLGPEDIKMIKFMREKGFEEDQIARFLGVTEICIHKAKERHKIK